MLKVTGPPKSYWSKMFFIDKKPLFLCNTLHYKSKDASLAIIYFDVGDLLSAFSQSSIWRTMLLQELFDNHMPSVEAAGAAGRVLTTNDAAACISSYS